MRERIVAWLDARPSPTAVAVLERPREIDPERFKPCRPSATSLRGIAFGDGHERTVWRFVKARRAAMAREVLLGTPPAVVERGLPARAA